MFLYLFSNSHVDKNRRQNKIIKFTTLLYLYIYTHSYIFLFFSSPHSKQNLFYNNKKYKKIGSNLSPSFLFVVLNTYICTCVDACGCMLFTAFPYFLPSCNNNSFVGVYLSWFFIIFRNPMLINWKACGGGLWDGCRQVKWICSSIHPTSIHVYLCTFKYRFRLLILSFIPIFCTVIFFLYTHYICISIYFFVLHSWWYWLPFLISSLNRQIDLGQLLSAINQIIPLYIYIVSFFKVKNKSVQFS